MINLLTIMLAKVAGKSSINSLSAIESNVELIPLMERIKVIDQKLKNQINKLIDQANEETKNNGKSITQGNKGSNISEYRPKILYINEGNDMKEIEESDGEFNQEKGDESDVSEISDSNEGSESEKSVGKKTNKKNGNNIKSLTPKVKTKYKIRGTDIEFNESKTERNKRRNQLKRDKEKIRDSETLKNLKNETSDKPIEMNPYDSHYSKFLKDVDDYERNNLTNLAISKRIKKVYKKKDGNIEDLGKIESNLKQISNVLNDGKDTFSKGKNWDNNKRSKFLGKKRNKK